MAFVRSLPPSSARILHEHGLPIGCSTSTCRLLAALLRGKAVFHLSRPVAATACVRRGNPRPDAATVEQKRAGTAPGGSDLPTAPRSSLFALELQAQRCTAEELRAVDNRFPFRDRFELSNGKSTTSSEILAALEADAAPERLQRISRVAAGRTFSVVPLLEGVHDRGNIGAVARSADALGFGSLHYVRTLEPKKLKTGSGSRTSGGAQKWMDVQVWDTVGACLRHMKAAGFFIAATHLAPGAIPITELDWTRPTVIVLGNEGFGVTHEALSHADAAVVIPQAPCFVDSLNVSVAAALALYEARTARIRALGASEDLSPEQRRVLTAAMLLRHKGLNARVRQEYGMCLERLDALDQAARGEEHLWTEVKERRYSGRRTAPQPSDSQRVLFPECPP